MIEELHLFGNYFAGKLPTELANLKNLGTSTVVTTLSRVLFV
jgi:hypothetical protein